MIPVQTPLAARRPSRFHALRAAVAIGHAAGWAVGGLVALGSIIAGFKSPIAAIVGIVVAFLLWVGLSVGADAAEALADVAEDVRAIAQRQSL